MKPRQSRYDVTISALVRNGLAVSSARILNASLRGLMLVAAVPPVVGSYVELQAQKHTIIARVVWANDHHFGVLTQDRVPATLVPEIDRNSAPAKANAFQNAKTASTIFENSQSLGRSLQFACVIMFSVTMAAVAAECVKATLARPIAVVRTALGGQPASQ